MGLWTLLAFDSCRNTFNVLYRMIFSSASCVELNGPWRSGKRFSCIDMTVPNSLWVGKVHRQIRDEAYVPSSPSISQVHSRLPSGWFCLIYAVDDP